MSTFILALNVKSPDKFLKKLRGANPPVIARVEEDKVYFDPRTVFEEQDAKLLSTLRSLL